LLFHFLYDILFYRNGSKELFSNDEEVVRLERLLVSSMVNDQKSVKKSGSSNGEKIEKSK